MAVRSLRAWWWLWEPKSIHKIRRRRCARFTPVGPREAGEPIESFTIITTDANELVADIHDRMPVILSAESYGVWLDPEIDDPRALESLLTPYPADEVIAVLVGTVVNSPRNDSPECVEPVQAE